MVIISWRGRESVNNVLHNLPKILVVLAVFVSLFGTLSSQDRTTYIFTGTVVDSTGDPSAGAEVTITPPGGANPGQSDRTDSEGRFHMRYQMGTKIDKWRIWVSSGSFRSGEVLFPFSDLAEIDPRFEGRPFSTVGQLGEINVGAIPVDFYFLKTVIPIRIEGRKLTKEEWLLLWCRVLDDEGKTLGDRSIGPKLEGITMLDSTFSVSLPTGRWKIEFLKFDGNFKISKDAVGSTDYFEVVRGKPQTLEPINIKLKGVKMMGL